MKKIPPGLPLPKGGDHTEAPWVGIALLNLSYGLNRKRRFDVAHRPEPFGGTHGPEHFEGQVEGELAPTPSPNHQQRVFDHVFDRL